LFASQDGRLTGFEVFYANGRSIKHGNVDNIAWSCPMATDIVLARTKAGRARKGELSYVDTVEFVIADDKTGAQPAAWPLNVSTAQYVGDGEERATVDVCEVVEQPPMLGGNVAWTVRVFFGETRMGVVSRLGVVWGRG
jgi:hypothetical protein